MAKNYNASFHYRISVPLQTMEDMGLEVIPVLDDHRGDVPNENRVIAFTYSDINLLYQPISWGLLNDMRKMNELGPGRLKNGKWRWPPTFITDTDDNLFDIHPLNPAFRTLGWRGPEGDPLKDGDEVKITGDDGKAKTLWKDGERGFDVRKNRGTLESYRNIGRDSAAITCSTAEVEKYVHREIGNTNTFVYPNSIRFDWYPKIELGEHSGKVRVLWQGSTTHYEDLWPLADSFERLAKKYPFVEWVFWGANYRFVTNRIPKENLVVMPWAPYSEYRLRLSTINHDINLCPLGATRFSVCRSAIKWYESSAICKPAASLAQKTGAYADEIQDGETGMLWETLEEFEAKLSGLIEDEKLRKTLASNAKDWMKTHRDAFKTVPALFEFYQRVRKAREIAHPIPAQGNGIPMEELEFDENAHAFDTRKFGLGGVKER